MEPESTTWTSAQKGTLTTWMSEIKDFAASCKALKTRYQIINTVFSVISLLLSAASGCIVLVADKPTWLNYVFGSITVISGTVAGISQAVGFQSNQKYYTMKYTAAINLYNKINIQLGMQKENPEMLINTLSVAVTELMSSDGEPQVGTGKT